VGQWYVALDGDDTDDCLSTTTPCATINVPITQTLGWQGGDPDAGDTVTYTIAISVSGQSPVVATTALTGYMPSLIANTTYY